MSDNIAFEIQMEIIKRLPVKSLFQFRSVSKSWKSLIDSPQFISDYNHCQSRPQRLLIIYEDQPRPRCIYGIDPKYVCIVDDENFPQNKFPTTIPMSVDIPDKVKLIGSYQGLFCLLGEYGCNSYYQEKAFIWNPAIRKSIAIDVPVMHEMYTTILGFGVCPNTSEPMLVRISNDDDFPFQVEVFTLSSGVWRTPRSNLPCKSIVFTRYQVAIDGFIYWQTLNRLIVSFDMRSEEFAEVDLPRSLVCKFVRDMRMCNLRGSLAVLQHYTEAEKLVCAVWMLEHGDQKSFTKLFTITTPNSYLMKVLGFKKNGEAILETKRDDCHEQAVLEVYEPSSKCIKDLGIYGGYGSFFMTSYTETLLLLDRADNNI